MRKFILIAILALLVCSEVVFGEEVKKGKGGQKMNAEQRMQLRRKQMQLEEAEVEAGFRQRMRELNLEEREFEIERQRKELEPKRHGGGHKCGKMLMVIFIIIHILLAIWVYRDIANRKSGSGIWIVIALLAGLLGTLVYAVVRLGDVRAEAG